jgi:hypothetical protein
MKSKKSYKCILEIDYLGNGLIGKALSTDSLFPSMNVIVIHFERNYLTTPWE